MIAILLVPVGLAVLLLFAAHEGYFGLQLDPKIRVADGFNVICTTILALTLQYFLARRNTEESALRQQSADAIADLLSALRDLREAVSNAVNVVFPTDEQTRKIVNAFESVTECLMMLDWTLNESISIALKERKIDLTGKVLACKREITGGNFPKRLSTYADVELVSVLRREIAGELVPLQRRALHARSSVWHYWQKFAATVEREGKDPN